ncbi:MAG: hypothetical protein JSV86_03020 [Gemmatimonadota bacterium]|nr:MAG: hypothetical protein JSV86_03020 [Gemmatimonadota bacterium]
MTKMKKTGVLATLLLLGGTACADLDVVNPNDPEAERALATAENVLGLIGGTFRQWYIGGTDYAGGSFHQSVISFQTSAPWNNAGMVPLGWLPRPELVNDAADQWYPNQTYAWYQAYKAIAPASDGLRAILTNDDLRADLDADTLRAMAFSRFVQGLGYAYLAVSFDQAFIVDETSDLQAPQELRPYGEVMTAALGYLDQALALAEAESFTIPASWMSVEVSSDELIRLIHGYKARYRAAVARTPTERAAVNWDLVWADADAGVTADWLVDVVWADWNCDSWCNLMWNYFAYSAWQQLTYFILGMADQSGNYQAWLDIPILNRLPAVAAGGPLDVLIITPDLRFVQGNTWEEQEADCPYDPGSDTYCLNRDPFTALWAMPGEGYAVLEQWAKPERQTWRWSNYFSTEPWNIYGGDIVEMSVDEMNMLKAEAHYWNGELAEAANLINLTRVPAGLNATDAAGLNTSCVPKLPNETCGDLYEMLKWEWRLEVWGRGLHDNPWYFNGRGWGDLYKGTWLHYPVPCGEFQVLQITPCYTFGSSSDTENSSQGSIYAWPFEE